MIQASIELKLYLCAIATVLMPLSSWAITWARYMVAKRWSGRNEVEYEYTDPFDPHWRGYTFVGLCVLWGLILG